MTAKLILTFNDRPIGDYPLTKKTITIGRKLDNDIQVNDLAVSGHHTRIVTILNNSFLEDLGSTNGTYVNGRITRKHALHAGDTIKIGKHHLEYHNDATADDDDFEKTMVIRANTDPGESGDATPGAYALLGGTADGPSRRQAVLKVVSGPNMGRELKLTKALTTIGRPGVQVAGITRRPAGFFLISVVGGSGKNHLPCVNGDPIGAQARELHARDVIEVAGVKMEFCAL